ncbi:KamA family radical SAM protein [Leptospira ognonensis]|uniref:KamA family radical SAM protein n=1 Tax=Leptospira ognonensis TaxID=2484945 RepID=A0A4R9K6I9_9LEPT|nr:KamA family radical SAM protein [Leptospira ognonensis]TGL61889.1 KamA family radical SAM protein [Leptospira ognonensis]
MTWNDWKWQLQNRIVDLETLQDNIALTEEEKVSFQEASAFFSFSVTPYYLSLIDRNNPNCPIRKQTIPRPEELVWNPNEVEDPLAEQKFMPVKGVTHRYPDRALWYISHTCAVYCRFCTRKRKVSKPEETPNREEWEKALEYFRSHSEIREVILSGGDPLTLADSQLDYLLDQLNQIKHINHIRIHSRYPVTLPMRITPSLCEVLSKYFPLYLVSHFNHSSELTKEACSAIKMLIQKGNVIVLNQSVLLNGINDTVKDLEELNYKLIRSGVKPYYLHQCDEVVGSGGFVVPITKGLEIMFELRGRRSGISIPTYVKDLTGGGGKVTLNPNYLVSANETKLVMKNYNEDEFEISH